VAGRAASGRWLTEAEVREALQRLDPIWKQLFAAEQARVIQLLVERVDVGPDGVDRGHADAADPQQR
jgi:hypothetical protein